MSKVIVITGASKNLGKSLAVGLSRLGHRLVLTGRKMVELEELSGRLESEYLLFEGNINHYTDCQNVMQQAVHKFGQVDVLINNASLFLAKNLQNSSIEEIDSILDITVKGSLYMSKAFLEQTVSGGQILSIIPSQYRHGLSKGAEMTPYFSAKFALVGMLESLKHEGAGRGIKATSLFVDTMASTLDLDHSAQAPDNLIPPQVVVDTVNFVINQPKATVIDDITISQVTNFI